MIKKELSVSSKFIYCISVYIIWKTGASLIDEEYYSCPKPLNYKKIQRTLKTKEYVLQRFISLKSAPRDYLINNGYKIKDE